MENRKRGGSGDLVGCTVWASAQLFMSQPVYSDDGELAYTNRVSMLISYVPFHLFSYLSNSAGFFLYQSFLVADLRFFIYLIQF